MAALGQERGQLTTAKLSTESTLGAVTWCSTGMHVCIWRSTEMQGLSWHSTETHVCIWHSTELQGLYTVSYRDVSVGLWLTILCGNAYADGVQSVSSCRLLKD